MVAILNKPVIFHADDYNLTPGVSRGIIEAHRRGVVRSTSIMANTPDFKESVELLKECPDLDVGVHINLTFGSPLSGSSEVPSLVDDNGTFWRKPGLLRVMADVEEMRREVELQFQRCLEAGLNLTHLDSHHHVHDMLPRVLTLLIELAKKYKLAVRSLNHDMRDRLQKEGIPTSDNFNGDFYGIENITKDNLKNILDSAPNGFCEIMCHPGYADEELTKKSTYNKAREVELELLTDPEILKILAERDARIIGYREILKFFPGFEVKDTV